MSATLAAGAAGALAAPELPRADCSKRFVDAEGDGRPKVTPLADANNAVIGTTGTDITSVFLRLTPEELQVFVGAKDIPAPASMPDHDTAYRWTVTFKGGGKTFEFGAMQLNPDPPHASAKPADATQYPKANTGTGAGNELPGFTATIDDAKNFVIFTAPRARVEQNLGAPLAPGDVFESVYAKTQHNIGLKLNDADETALAAEQAKFVVGDDYCFGPPPAKLAELTTPNVQFGDSVTLSASLASEKDEAIAGKAVRFTVAGEPLALTDETGEDGTASVTYTPTLPAGTYEVVASFPGDADHGKASVVGSIVVASEITKFNPLHVAKPNATTRIVTATLVDDDRRGLGGQKVDWYVNGRKVATLTTDAAGRSVYRGARPTQTVQARFAEVAGKFKAANSAVVKV